MTETNIPSSPKPPKIKRDACSNNSGPVSSKSNLSRLLLFTLALIPLISILFWVSNPFNPVPKQNRPAQQTIKKEFLPNIRPKVPHGHDYNNYIYFTAELSTDLLAHEVAHHLDLEYLHQVGELDHHHLFRKPVRREGDGLNIPRHEVSKEVLDKVSRLTDQPTLWKKILRRDEFNNKLAEGIRSVTVQEPKPSKRRIHRREELGYDKGEGTNGLVVDRRSPLSRSGTYNTTLFRELGIHDPGFKNQWHFHNVEGAHHDLNVTGLWKENITGKGVVVAIVDDGIDFEHEDIRENYFKEGSFDFNKNRPDPYPDTELDTHGTRCAGQVAGLRNDVCGIGIAYGAKVAGIRILSLPIGDDAEAHAINYGYHINHVYSCSWGPPDDGLAMDRPPKIVEDAIQKGALEGRNGKGTVFVFASGNGGIKNDNCNFDGYTNSVYSITVGSVDFQDKHPEYSESCTALMISAYSSGSNGHRIYTSSSWRNACTDSHGGTSAAAPMVAGIIALALEKRPDLTWRDFQHISVQSAVSVSEKDSSWERTWAGRPYSMKFGFGRIDGYKFVHHAMNFKSVGPQVFYDTPTINMHQNIPHGNKGLTSVISISPSDLASARLRTLEHVTITVDIQHQCRSDLVIDLISPNGFLSHLAVPRSKDDSSDGFPNWTFMTVKHWDEPAVGKWTLRVYDVANPRLKGKWNSWQLRLWGEEFIPSNITEPTPPVEVPTQTFTLPSPSESSITTSTSASTVPTTEPPTKPGFPDLEEVSRNYRPTSFILFLLSISGFLLVTVAITFIYRRRSTSADYQQLEEMRSNDDAQFVLDNVSSGSPPSQPNETDPREAPEVLFELDDPLLDDLSDSEL